MSNAAAASFDEALTRVDTEVKAFEEKAFAEQVSQAEKNSALYAALDKAYAFHMKWGEHHQYAKFLADRKVVDVPRGSKSSQFTPTIKAFFDPSWDQFDPAGDEKKKKEKARRQKTISTYSGVLDYAAHERINDVVSFLATGGGIEAVRIKWKKKRSELPEEIEKRQKAADVKNQRLALGLAGLQKGMQTSLPSDPHRKESPQLAAIYYDETGVAHFLGLPDQDDSAKALLERFLLSNAGPNNLTKLLSLLKAGVVANAKDANVLIKNDKSGCEIHASANSSDTCVVSAKLPHQDFLPEGTHWFGSKAIRGLKKLSPLGKYGAQFIITGPAKIAGIDASWEIQLTDYRAGVAAIEDWDWNKVIPDTPGCVHTENDDVMTITYVSTIEDMARIKPIAAWDGEVNVDGAFADWLQAALGISNDDANQRLFKAIRDEGRPTTAFRITDSAWTITDEQGDVVTYAFQAPISSSKFTIEMAVGSKDILTAIDAVKALVDGGTVSISLVDKLMRVQCKKGSVLAEVFIPSIGTDGRHQAYTEFDQPLTA